MTSRRAPTINGVPLDTVLAPVHAQHHREPLDVGYLLVDVVPAEEQLAWIHSLRGGTSLPVLENGRTALAYCAGCLDDSDGWLLACRITTSEATVTWDRFGIDNDTDLYERHGARDTVPPPPSGWFEECFDDHFAIVFDRAQYDGALAEECARITSTGDVEKQ